MAIDQNRTTGDKPVPDEFWNGLWWVPDGVGRFRNASPRECAAEIMRLRERVRLLEAAVLRLWPTVLTAPIRPPVLPNGTASPTRRPLRSDSPRRPLAPPAAPHAAGRAGSRTPAD